MVVKGSSIDFVYLTPLYLAAGSATAGQVLIQGSLTQLFFMHQLTFGLRGTERILLKSIEHDYIRIIKVSVFPEMGISKIGKT